MFQEEESGGSGWREGEVVSGDLQLWRCIEVYTADRSVMDFRMS